MTDPAEEFVRKIERIRPEPGDHFVLTVETRLSVGQIENIRATWDRFIGRQWPLLVLDKDCSLRCIAGQDQRVDDCGPAS